VAGQLDDSILLSGSESSLFGFWHGGSRDVGVGTSLYIDKRLVDESVMKGGNCSCDVVG